MFTIEEAHNQKGRRHVAYSVADPGGWGMHPLRPPPAWDFSHPQCTETGHFEPLRSRPLPRGEGDTPHHTPPHVGSGAQSPSSYSFGYYKRPAPVSSTEIPTPTSLYLAHS